MKILVIGGTQFVGRHFVAAALGAGHEVTLFHRGKTNPGLFDGVEEVFGDRRTDIEKLDGSWDVVVDTCGYIPKDVDISAKHLKGKVGRYVFVSTTAVYRELSKEGIDERGYLKTLEDPELEELNRSTYGPLKTECEARVTAAFDHDVFIVRPGVICGPWDATDRFTYWVSRVGRGGEVLAPEDPGAKVQLLDARDLAKWMVASIEKGRKGIFNATGPVMSFEEMLEACRRATGSDAEFMWVSRKFMEATEIDEPSKMPLWNPEAKDRKAGIFAVDSSKAYAAGLECRPIEESARDVWEWIEADAEHPWTVGLDLLEERQLLDRWEEFANDQ